MLTEIRNMPQVKLTAVTLIGCLLLTSCGGGGGEGGDTGGPGPTTEVTLSLADPGQDISQGSVITVDFQGPAFGEEDLVISVGDTSVGGAVIDDQIHFILPLTASGPTLLTFDFGRFSAGLFLDIDPAPEIADPPAYASDLIDDLVFSLDRLDDGDLLELGDALLEAQAELATLSEDELRALAIFFAQNIEPVLQQLDSPVVAQFDLTECDNATGRYLVALVVIAIAVSYTAVGTKSASSPLIPPKVRLLIVVAAASALVLSFAKALVTGRELSEVCIVKGFDSIFEAVRESVGSSSVQVAQDSSTLRFDNGVATRLVVEENRRFAGERRSEVAGATQELIEGLLNVNEKLRQLAVRFPTLARRFNLSSFIDRIDRYISEFALLQNPDHVAPADHTNLRLVAISDPNISGAITAATTDAFSMRFAFNNDPRMIACYSRSIC